MDYSRPELADRLAAAYVSGLLRGPARRRMQTLLPAHPALRHAVQAWQDRLMPLTISLPPVSPPPSVWHAVSQRTGAAPSVSPPRTLAAPDSAWWQRVSFWRGLSAMATVAAVSLSVLLANPGPSQPPMVVVLSATPDASGVATGGVVPASLVASISGDGRAVVTKPLTPVALQADRALELWAVPANGAPRSLGLVSAQRASVVQINKVPAGTAALAVSLEPAGGSPTGALTGPILFVGKLGV
jgi:anti-sigma-K factor RskA